MNKSDFEDAVGPGDHQSPAPTPVPKRSSSTVTGIAPAINLRGEECVTTTGTDGKYEFAYLAAGEYVAIFMDGETVLSDFYMSPLEADTAREVNNSNTILVAADEEGHVDYGYLYVTMPQADDIKASPYMIRNEDMGLVEAINIYAEKKWQTADGGEEPPEGAKITFTLTGGGKTYSVELDGTPDDPLDEKAIGAYESAAWYATFQNLPKYDVDDTGKTVEIEYELTESVKWPAFTDTYSDNAGALTEGDVGTVTNTETTMEVLVKKAWQNADGTTTPPEGAQVTFTLYADGDPTGYSVPLDGTPDEEITGAGGFEAKPWNALFRKLPKYKVVEGEATEIQYTVEESGQWPGYTVVYPDATVSFAVSGETITNVQEKTELSVIKAWLNADGTTTAPEGASVTFTLVADGTDTNYTAVLDGTADAAITTTGGYESEAWKATFVNLPKYKTANGSAVEIRYTVKETGKWAGYIVIYEGEGAVSAIADGVITNKQEDTYFFVNKVWQNADGTTDAPEGATVTIELYADGVTTGETVELDGVADQKQDGKPGYEGKPWTATFSGLPKYKAVNGEAVEIVYTAVESGTWPGYTVTYAGGETATYANHSEIITNKQETTELSVIKAWQPLMGDVPAGANVTFTL